MAIVNMAEAANTPKGMNPVQPDPEPGSAAVEGRWQAVLNRDATADGKFVFGVTSTGIYCRPTCPARRPRRDRVRFFDSPQAAERAGLRACLRCKPNRQAGAAPLVERICRYIEAHCEEKITLEALSKVAGMSAFHLQRRFKREMGISPRQYLESFRFAKFKCGLRNGTVTQALVESGYSSPSRVYETASKKLGMAPRRFGAGAPRERLRFTTFTSELGEVLLAASDAGVCGVQFLGKDAGEARMRSEYPRAEVSRDDAGLETWAAAVTELIRGQKAAQRIPLDIRGTAFQQLVWQQLQKIPAGQTRSYTEVARAMRKPQAVRAVAGACASNRIAVVIPCHRVVHGDGTLSGYRWGTERKRRLLEAEAARTRH